MENVVLGHRISKLFWMPAKGRKQPLVWEDVIKHKKYTIVVANEISVHIQWPCPNYPVVSWNGVGTGLKDLCIDFYIGSAASLGLKLMLNNFLDMLE